MTPQSASADGRLVRSGLAASSRRSLARRRARASSRPRHSSAAAPVHLERITRLVP